MHVPCPNHCILYCKEYEFNTKYPVCGVSRYKRSYNHVYADTTMKKIKNKNKTAIGTESVDDKADNDKEDKTKRKKSCLGDVVHSSDRSFETCVLQP
jgi:hypothetical protein